MGKDKQSAMNGKLLKEDYDEPQALLNMHPESKLIPVGRVMEKLDAYLNRKDYAAAGRHLQYWLAEAEACRDFRGKLTVLNEQIGLYRKTDREAECLQTASAAISLADELGLEKTVTYGTTLVNAATGFKAFGKVEEALPLYRRARTVYETYLDEADGRLGGLYNNMALTLSELGAYREAEELFRKAIHVMEQQENGALEVAITYLNLADLAAAEYGLEAAEEEIQKDLTKAEALLNDESLPRDGYYAFVCEKCAPGFGYYGYFLTKRELERRAKEIYDRT